MTIEFRQYYNEFNIIKLCLVIFEPISYYFYMISNTHRIIDDHY